MTCGLRAFLVMSLVALVGCGDGGSEEASAPDAGRVVSDPGVAHIHGVGVNPADDSVVVATHTGLFRAGPGEQRARRVGDRRQDTMGFTVVGPDRFLGSGHPDARDDLPPLLGLIRSDDAGRSWQPVSLLGEADFHVLRTSGRRVYGVNATDGEASVMGKGRKPRTVAYGNATAKALGRYFRLRSRHPQSERSDRGRGPVDGASLYTMLTRRAARVGVELHPHQLRHFFADAWLRENGSEGGLMRAAGWSNRAMLDRYASANAAQRSRAERRRLTLGDGI